MVADKIKMGGVYHPSSDEEKRIVTRFAFMTTLGVPEELMGEDVALDAYGQFVKLYQNSSWVTHEALNDCKVVTVSGFGKVSITDKGVETGFYCDAFLIDGLGQVTNVEVNKDGTMTFTKK